MGESSRAVRFGDRNEYFGESGLSLGECLGGQLAPKVAARKPTSCARCRMAQTSAPTRGLETAASRRLRPTRGEPGAMDACAGMVENARVMRSTRYAGHP